MSLRIIPSGMLSFRISRIVAFDEVDGYGNC